MAAPMQSTIGMPCVSIMKQPYLNESAFAKPMQKNVFQYH